VRSGEVVDGITLEDKFGGPWLNNEGVIVFSNFSSGPATIFVMTTAGRESAQRLVRPGDTLDGVSVAVPHGAALNNVATLDSLNGNLTVAAANGVFKARNCVHTANDLTCEFDFLIDDCDHFGIGSSGFDSAPINDNGEVTFTAGINPTTENRHAIFKHSGGECAIVVTAGQVINEKCIAQQGETHHLVPSRSFRNDGTVLFQAPFGSELPECVFPLSPDGFGVFTSKEGLLAETGTEVTLADGTVIDGKTLTFIQNPWANEQGEVIFNGQFAGGSGIFSTQRGLLVETGDTIDGHTLGSPTYDTFVSSVNNSGQIMFTTAVDQQTRFGLFTPSRAIIVPGDVIDGKTVLSVQEFSLNDEGKAVVIVAFEDGSGALVLATPREVPPPEGGVTLPTGGKVVIELLTSDSTSLQTLSLVSPAVAVPQSGCEWRPATGMPVLPLMNGQAAQSGCRVMLDAEPGTTGIQPFAAGATLEFSLCVQTDADADCDFVWSSEQSKNTDGAEHVRITPLHSGAFPNQIFQLGWETEENGGDQDFNDFIAVVRVMNDVSSCPTCTTLDTDGDGLWDDWERFGIDTNGDATPDFDLPGEGANPNKPDIFVELDYMDCSAGETCEGGPHSHRPKAAALEAVVKAFATGGGDHGPIALHVKVDQAILHQDVLEFTSGKGNDFAAAKAQFFGPSNPQRFAYHYGIFAHRKGDSSDSSGHAELPGNDFMVSLGGRNIGWGDKDKDGLNDEHVGTVRQQAGTLMHELGHNLGLRHGGGDIENYKPNYPSVMNYTFQMGRHLPYLGESLLAGFPGYSSGGCGSLDENHLNEPSGVCATEFVPQLFCWLMLNPKAIESAGPGIDWNCNANALELGIKVDVNDDKAETVLFDHNDWDNLAFDFHSGKDFEDGEHGSGMVIDESGESSLDEELVTAQDSFMRQRSNDNEGSNHVLLIKKNYATVLGFDLSTITESKIRRAKLLLTVAQKARGWKTGGQVAVYRLSDSFTEGNGFLWKAKGPNKTRGNGPGVTWNCATDAEISNRQENCIQHWTLALDNITAQTASVLHTDTLTEGDVVVWDVTADIKDAVDNGATAIQWLVKPAEQRSGQVVYYSKEGSQAIEGHLGAAPHLLLAFEPS
jgi:hypothetical protein